MSTRSRDEPSHRAPEAPVGGLTEKTDERAAQNPAVKSWLLAQHVVRQRVSRRQRSWRPIRRSAGRRGLPCPAPFATHRSVLRDLRELATYGSLLRELVVRDLKVRYKRSVLGVLWTMLNPLFLMVILAFVFSHVLRVTMEHFPIYVLSALVLWNFFAQAT